MLAVISILVAVGVVYWLAVKKNTACRYAVPFVKGESCVGMTDIIGHFDSSSRMASMAVRSSLRSFVVSVEIEVEAKAKAKAAEGSDARLMMGQHRPVQTVVC